MKRVRTHMPSRAVALVVGAGMFSSVGVARDVTDVEMARARVAASGVIGSDDRILKVTARWGDVNGSPELWARATTRPSDVGEGLCVTETYIFWKKEIESEFRSVNYDAPISQYWPRATSCDADAGAVDDFGRLPNSVQVPQPIATTDVARIMRSAEEIIGLATPDVRCDEPFMPRLFQPGVRFRLIAIEIDRKNAPDVGIQYHARYRREGSRDDDGVGVIIRFAMFPDRFEVHFACFWIAD